MSIGKYNKNSNTIDIVQDEFEKQISWIKNTKKLELPTDEVVKMKTGKDVAFDFSAKRFAAIDSVKNGQYVFLGTYGMLELVGVIPKFEPTDTYIDLVKNVLLAPEIAPGCVLLYDVNKNSPNFVDNLIEVPMFSVGVLYGDGQFARYDFEQYTEPNIILDITNVAMLGNYLTFPDDVLFANANCPVDFFINGKYTCEDDFLKRAMLVSQVLRKLDIKKEPELEKFYKTIEENAKIMVCGCFAVQSMNKIISEFENKEPNKSFEQILDLQSKCFNQNLKASKMPLDDFIEACEKNVSGFNIQLDVALHNQGKKQPKERKLTKILQKLQ